MAEDIKETLRKMKNGGLLGLFDDKAKTPPASRANPMFQPSRPELGSIEERISRTLGQFEDRNALRESPFSVLDSMEKGAQSVKKVESWMQASKNKKPDPAPGSRR